MPRSFDVIFFPVGQNTYRLHFPYMLGGVEKKMLSSDDGGKFNSDTREYFINGFAYGSATYDIHVRERRRHSPGNDRCQVRSGREGSVDTPGPAG
jgi:hypothetical protein